MHKANSQTADYAVRIPAGDVTLAGDLSIPGNSVGLVMFAHGSGSSRHSPRNQYVAVYLREAGLATLLFDLLTAREEAEDNITAALRFDIDFLARRLIAAIDWLKRDAHAGRFNTGLFGASTGAAAALIAAAERPAVVGAVVSRGGRPDLADKSLPRVKAPTLLIVGGLDFGVIELNQAAYARLKSEKKLEIVPGATHLFEEPGTLTQVSRLAADWFVKYLSAGIKSAVVKEPHA